MSTQKEPLHIPRQAFWCFLIFAVWLSARIFVYFYNWPHFIPDMANDDTFHMWYLPPDFIKQNFLESLLYLRGEPPLPQIILGILIKILGWPLTIPADSLLLSLATLVTAYLMRSIIIRYGFKPVIANTIAILWCLYPACLGVEVAAFPTAFYEALPSLIFIISVWICLKCFEKKQGIAHSRLNSSSWIWLFGMAGAMLSMSRSTLSWIFLLPIIISIFLPGSNKKIIAGFLALIIQTSWAVKNYSVYGQFHLETASDVGQNVYSTILNTGNLDKFYSYISQKNPDDPFVTEGISCLIAYDQPCLEKFFVEEKLQDQALALKLGIGDNLYGESYFLHALSKKLKPLYLDFLLQNPGIALKMAMDSYKLFWGNIYWQVSYIKGLHSNNLILATNALAEKYKLANIAAIHSICILAAILIAVAAFKKKSLTDLQVGFYYAFLGFCYVAVISSLGDHGENARYRVDVEALVWLLPFMGYRCLQQLLQNKTHA